MTKEELEATTSKAIMNCNNPTATKLIMQGVEQYANQQTEELRAWKKEAIAVMPHYQEIGKILGVKLGDSVYDKIIPALKSMVTIEQALKIAGEAFDAGYKRGWGQSEFEGESVTPNKETFLSQLKTKLSQP